MLTSVSILTRQHASVLPADETVYQHNQSEKYGDHDSDDKNISPVPPLTFSADALKKPPQVTLLTINKVSDQDCHGNDNDAYCYEHDIYNGEDGRHIHHHVQPIYCSLIRHLQPPLGFMYGQRSDFPATTILYEIRY